MNEYTLSYTAVPKIDLALMIFIIVGAFSVVAVSHRGCNA